MSINNKLEHVRKPRVHIKYEVETEDACIEKELPFVVGVMGDYSGDATEPLQPLKKRKFTQIDRDNFNDVMTRQNPGLKLKVNNTLANNNTEMTVDLKFNRLEDFEPAQIVAQVPALSELKATRDQLRDLLNKADRSDRLEQILENLLKDSQQLQQLAQELSISTPEEEK